VLKSRQAGRAGTRKAACNYDSYIHRDAYKSGTKPAGNPRQSGHHAPRQVPFDPPEFLRPRRNYPTISEALLAFEYLRPAAPPAPQRRPSVLWRAGGRAGLFKLKSRRDLNFKISIWLANLSASFRPRERTTAFPPPRRRGQIARVRHQKSFTSRALFPPLPCPPLLLAPASPFASSPLLLR